MIKDKKKFYQYLISSIACLALVVAETFVKDVYGATTIKDVFGRLSDCFILPGVLTILASLLTIVNTQGLFDSIGYGLKTFFKVSTPSKHALDNRETFYEYRERKSKGRTWCAFLMVVGGVSTGIGIILFIIYAIL